MRQPLVAGNWKMHGSRAENAALVEALLIAASPDRAAEVAGLPAVRLPVRRPAGCCKDSRRRAGRAGRLRGDAGRVHRRSVGRHAQGRRLPLRDRRPFRAARTVRRERRARGAQVRRRASRRARARSSASARRWTSAKRGRTSRSSSRQLDAVLDRDGRRRARARPSSPTSRSGPSAPAGRRRRSRRRKCMRMIRGQIAALDATIAAIVSGSCTAAASRRRTPRELFAMPDIDGGLVGGASLKADEFARDLRRRGRD